jgi:hypothetical protein
MWYGNCYFDKFMFWMKKRKLTFKQYIFKKVKISIITTQLKILWQKKCTASPHTLLATSSPGIEVAWNRGTCTYYPCVWVCHSNRGLKVKSKRNQPSAFLHDLCCRALLVARETTPCEPDYLRERTVDSNTHLFRAQMPNNEDCFDIQWLCDESPGARGLKSWC